MTPQEMHQRNYPICQSIKSFNKVFGIGANKTATTSLQAVLFLLGLRVAPQDEGELCAWPAHRGDLRRLVQYVERYDAFQDVPFSTKSFYAQLDALFPGSKFVLTVRDPEAWYRSLSEFHKQRFQVGDVNEITPDRMRTHAYRFPGYMARNVEASWLIRIEDGPHATKDWSLLYDKEHYIRLYRSRNEEILRHFSERPNDLLVIDLTREADTAKVVDFLGLPRAFVTSMPRLNVTRPTS